MIEQEHHAWSAFARASTSTANSKAVSSLVFGNDFIYSYHFTERSEQWPMDNKHFLKLLIYARHGNAYDDNAVMEYNDIVGAMWWCLEVGCTSLQTH